MMSIDERAEQKVSDYLEHYGVKGMRWGIHKKPEVTEATISSTKSVIKDIEASNFKETKEKELKSIINAIKDKNSNIPIFIADNLESYSKKGYYMTGIINNNIILKNESGDTKSLNISSSIGDKLNTIYDSAQKNLLKADKVDESEKNNKKDRSSRIPDFTGDSIIEKIKKIANLPLVDWPEAIKKASLSHSDLDIFEDYLCHHGIDGQKWGIKHGPPYPLDKKTAKSIKNSGKVTINIKNLNDNDLQRIINRLNLEKQLKELTKEDTKKADTYLKKTLLRLRDTTANIIFKSVETAATAKLTNELKKKMKVNIDPPKDKK